jgi:hypothetical protein
VIGMWRTPWLVLAGGFLLTMGLTLGRDAHWSWWILALAASVYVAFFVVWGVALLKEQFDWRYGRTAKPRPATESADDSEILGCFP